MGSAVAGMAAGVIGACAQAKAMRAAIEEQRRQFGLSQSGMDYRPPRDRGPSLSEVAREHRARMAADHAETMRQARVGTWLLVAFVVAAGFAVANLLGVM